MKEKLIALKNELEIVVKQQPINEKQRKTIKEGKILLKKINQLLEVYNV